MELTATLTRSTIMSDENGHSTRVAAGTAVYVRKLRAYDNTHAVRLPGTLKTTRVYPTSLAF